MYFRWKLPVIIRFKKYSISLAVNRVGDYRLFNFLLFSSSGSRILDMLDAKYSVVFLKKGIWRLYLRS